MAIETLAADVKKRHGLSNLHIFTLGEGWTVFGFRTHPQGFQASVEDGEGSTIESAIRHLDAKLTAGPIKGRNLPWEES